MIVKISAKNGFIWDDSYLIGSEHIDAQHHQLFDLVNTLVSSCADGSAAEKVRNTLDFLVNYTVQHFNDEEALQIECNYPDFEAHKKLHDDFKITVIDLVNRFAEGGSSFNLSNEIKTTVVHWLVNHILSEDKRIGDHIQGKV